MPNRILKESICSSGSVDSLTWFEEAFFYRLIVNADDYGRMDARPAILKARLFPLKTSVTEKQIGEVLNKLSMAGMVQVYEYDQKPFLQLVAWNAHQQIRAKKSKYPEPSKQANSSNGNHLKSFEINGNQLKTNVPVIQSNTIQDENTIQCVNAPARTHEDFTFQQILDICKEISPKLYERHTNDPMGDYTLQSQLEEIQRGMTLDDIRALIVDFEKSCYTQPKFGKLGLLWVLNSPTKVRNGIDGDKAEKKPTEPEPPKYTIDEQGRKLDKYGCEIW